MSMQQIHSASGNELLQTMIIDPDSEEIDTDISQFITCQRKDFPDFIEWLEKEMGEKDPSGSLVFFADLSNSSDFCFLNLKDKIICHFQMKRFTSSNSITKTMIVNEYEKASLAPKSWKSYFIMVGTNFSKKLIKFKDGHPINQIWISTIKEPVVLINAKDPNLYGIVNPEIRKALKIVANIDFKK